MKRISASPQDNMLEVLKPHTNDGGRVLWQYQMNDTPFNINGRNQKKRTSNRLFFRWLGRTNLTQIPHPSSTKQEQD